MALRCRRGVVRRSLTDRWRQSNVGIAWVLCLPVTPADVPNIIQKGGMQDEALVTHVAHGLNRHLLPIPSGLLQCVDPHRRPGRSWNPPIAL